jgi:uroporphyrinogen decarboxylase
MSDGPEPGQACGTTTEVTPRERWIALLEGRTTDRIPTDYAGTAEVTERLVAELGCAGEDDLWPKLHIDKRRIIEPRWAPATSPSDPHADRWGVRFRKVHYGAGSYDEPFFHPLARAETPGDVAAHHWPSPDDFDYAAVTEMAEKADGRYPIHAGCFEPFLLYGYLRGLEKSYEDLALRPALAEAILGSIFEFFEEHHRRLFAAGKGRIDLTWVAEDLGSQTGPLMSLAMYRRFLLPHQIRMADLARKHGIHVLYHTDGAARIFLPDLIDRVGIEILDPIQWRCPGMDREGLVKDFGRRIAFHGAIDNQWTLPFGSLEDVAGEVRQSAKIFEKARWICAPCHNIQPNTPTINILTLYATIHELSKGRNHDGSSPRRHGGRTEGEQDAVRSAKKETAGRKKKKAPEAEPRTDS